MQINCSTPFEAALQVEDVVANIMEEVRVIITQKTQNLEKYFLHINIATVYSVKHVCSSALYTCSHSIVA